MTHEYILIGMTCCSCEAKVRNSLLSISGITDVVVSKTDHSASITMQKHLDIATLQQVLDKKYTISVAGTSQSVAAEPERTWFETYKPIVLIFAYLILLSGIAGYSANSFDWSLVMRVFMGGFFLVFSFFKMLNLSRFVSSYAMYDIVAKRFSCWGYIYACVELFLGIAFLTGSYLMFSNLLTLLVMTISLIGVVKSVFSKRKIQCACLGGVFNLPMSTVTILEDGLMIAMSIGMLLML